MATFQVAEQIVIAAEPARVRAVLRDFRQWNPWSPWAAAEPDCPMRYEADGSGYAWEGSIIGTGAMKIASESDSSLQYVLTFFKPWKATNRCGFELEPVEGGTRVRWTMDGSVPLFLFFLRKMMSAWVGADFRRGLLKLKDYVETGSVPSVTTFAGVGDGLVSAYIGIRDRRTLSDIGEAMSRQFERLGAWMKQAGIEATGAPMSIYHDFDMPKSMADYTAAIPVASVPSSLPSDLVGGQLDAPRTYKVVHTGAYRHLPSAWAAAMMHQRAKVFRSTRAHPPFERYQNDPASTPEAALITELHLPAA